MTITDFLAQNSISFKPTKQGEWLEIKCPFASHSKNRCYINAHNGAWHCFHCGNGGHWSYIREGLKLPDEQVELEIHPITDKDTFDPPPLDQELVNFQHETLLKTKDILEYLYTIRGYTDETIEKFKLGWDGRNITIPISDANGDIVNIKFRRDPTLPNAAKKMWQLSGRGTARLFNEAVLKRKNDRVIICEGEWDCMRLDQEGYAAVTSTSGAMAFYPEWVKAFKKAKKTYICLDQDKTGVGQAATYKIAKMFLNKGITTYVINLPSPTVLEEKIDLVDFFVKRGKTKLDFTLLLKGAEPFIGKRLSHEVTIFSSGEELYDMEFPPDRWIIEHLIPEDGLTCIAGMQGSMKSYLTNYLTQCIVEKKQAFGLYSTKKCNVLFIDKENSLARLKLRFKALGVKKEDMANVFFQHGTAFLIENNNRTAEVESFIQTHKIKLVFIDTLIRIHSKRENDASEMNQVFHVLRRFVNTGASVCFLHHYNKRSMGAFASNNIVELLRGSSDILAAVDIYIGLEITKQGLLKLELGKSRDEALLDPILVEPEFDEGRTRFHFIKSITREEAEMANVADRILFFLQQQDRQRADITGYFIDSLSVPTIDRGIKELKEKKKITTYKNAEGHWYAVNKTEPIVD